MRHHVVGIVAIWVGCGASSPHVVETTDRLAVSEPVLFRVASDGARERIADGGSLASGDTIVVEIATTRPAYLYLLQRHCNGSVEAIVPGPNDPPVRSTANELAILPPPSAGYEISLDEVVGDDTLYVVASAHPLDIAIQQDGATPACAPVPAPTPTTPALAPEPDPPEPPPPVATPAKPMKRVTSATGTPTKKVTLIGTTEGFRRRGVVRKRKPTDRFTFSVEAPDTDDVIVRRIRFHHE